MHIGSRHERHDVVKANQAQPAIENFPNGVVGEDVTQLFWFKRVQCLGVARRKLDDVEAIVGGQLHAFHPNLALRDMPKRPDQ